jgi:hypothetical protein
MKDPLVYTLYIKIRTKFLFTTNEFIIIKKNLYNIKLA